MDSVRDTMYEKLSNAMAAIDKINGKVTLSAKPMAECLEEIATKSVAWYRSLSPEERARVDADHARPQAEKEAELFAVWGIADTKKDNLLQRDELPNLFNIYDERETARGVPCEP